jgi:hypothetical protein
VTGPYETERQAADAARHIYDSPPGPAWGEGNHRLLEDACTAAGVQLGAYDHRILLWLAGWEPSACAVIAGIIRRASRPAACRPMCTDDLDPATGEAFGVDPEADPLGEAG